MAYSKKWLKAILGRKRSIKGSTHAKAADNEHEKPSRWNLWKSCRVVDKGSTLADDDDEEFAQNGSGVLEKNMRTFGTTGDSDQKERAAIRIQTAFRGFLARRALRALRGLKRLQAAISGHGVHNQSVGSLRCIQAFVRVQARIRAHRVLKSRECQGMPQKLAGQSVETRPTEPEGGWCDSIGTVEDMQAKVQQRQEAAIKRERALAYAFSNQWRANSKINTEGLFDYELENSTWSWIWLDRWISGRPGEKNGISKQSSTKSPLQENAAKNNDLKKSASLNVSSTVNSRVYRDKSKINHRPFARARSHGAADSVLDMHDKPAKKHAANVNGELSSVQTERQASSNPKQQTKEVKRRKSLPNPIRRSTNHRNVRSTSSGKALNEKLESEKTLPEDTLKVHEQQRKSVE